MQSAVVGKVKMSADGKRAKLDLHVTQDIHEEAPEMQEGDAVVPYRQKAGPNLAAIMQLLLDNDSVHRDRLPLTHSSLRVVVNNVQATLKRRGSNDVWNELATNMVLLPAKSKSRCGSVTSAPQRTCPHVKAKNNENIRNVALTKTEGVFCTMDMRTGEILHMGEMLNAECTAYKEMAMQCVLDMCQVGVLCHDCACQLGAFEGQYCNKVILDGLKYKKHKCDAARFSPVHKNNVRRMFGLNTQVVEQLWSRTNLFGPALVKMRRDHYRLFIRSYCVWRNNYTRSGMSADVNPSLSSKQVKQRMAERHSSAGSRQVKRRPAARQ